MSATSRRGVEELRSIEAIEDGPTVGPAAVPARLRPAPVRDALRLTRGWLPEGRSLPLSDWLPRHRWLVALLWAHAVALPLFALARGYSLPHSVLEGGGIALFAAAASLSSLPLRWRSALAAVGLVTCSAILVHFSGGTIEAHFHFFVVLILLTLYEDWIPFLIAFGYVVVHHGLAGTLAPQTVYNHPAAIEDPWKWALIHGAFVSAAGVGAIVAWRLNETTRARAGSAIATALQSQEANELRERFLAITSHELRTPLTSIAGFATTLSHRWDDLPEPEKLRSVEIIESQTARLSALIEELLLLSSLQEGGRIRIRRDSVDVREVVERLVSGLGPGPEIRIDVPPGVVGQVDERYFVQILENFLSNARKYGAPPIVVEASTSARWLEVTVSDLGPGVPDDFVPQLFEPFSRGGDDGGVRGSGLGLAIVRGLVEAQGGDAWYERTRTRGACFKARFPQGAPVPSASG